MSVPGSERAFTVSPARGIPFPRLVCIGAARGPITGLSGTTGARPSAQGSWDWRRAPAAAARYWAQPGGESAAAPRSPRTRIRARVHTHRHTLTHTHTHTHAHARTGSPAPRGPAPRLCTHGPVRAARAPRRWVEEEEAWTPAGGRRPARGLGMQRPSRPPRGSRGRRAAPAPTRAATPGPPLPRVGAPRPRGAREGGGGPRAGWQRLRRGTESLTEPEGSRCPPPPRACVCSSHSRRFSLIGVFAASGCGVITQRVSPCRAASKGLSRPEKTRERAPGGDVATGPCRARSRPRSAGAPHPPTAPRKRPGCRAHPGSARAGTPPWARRRGRLCVVQGGPPRCLVPRTAGPSLPSGVPHLQVRRTRSPSPPAPRGPQLQLPRDGGLPAPRRLPVPSPTPQMCRRGAAAPHSPVGPACQRRGPGGRPGCCPGPRTGEAPRAGGRSGWRRTPRRGPPGGSSGPRSPLGRPEATRAPGTPLPAGAGSCRPSSRPSGRSRKTCSFGRIDRKWPRERWS